MIYSAKVIFDDKAGVALVGGKDKKEAMQKVITLYSPYEIQSIVLMEIPQELLGKLETFYKGGLTLAEFTEYGD